MDQKPTIPEVIDRFRAYAQDRGKGAWGSLHVVLDDQNVEDVFVLGAIRDAEANDDPEGAALARILLRMSKTQRSRIGKLVRPF